MCWLGAGKPDGEWKWLNKEPFKYAAWNGGQPSADKEAKHILLIKGGWKAEKNDPQRYHQVYACEWDSK